MNVNKDTVFINHNVGVYEECFGVIITELDYVPHVNLLMTRYGTTYGSPGFLKGAAKLRSYVWTCGEDRKNEIHIISAQLLNDMIINNVKDIL